MIYFSGLRYPLRATYTVHLRLTAKLLVVDVSDNGTSFAVSVTAEMLRVNIDSKSAF